MMSVTANVLPIIRSNLEPVVNHGLQKGINTKDIIVQINENLIHKLTTINYS